MASEQNDWSQPDYEVCDGCPRDDILCISISKLEIVDIEIPLKIFWENFAVWIISWTI